MTVEMFLIVHTRDRQLERHGAWNPCSTPTTTIIAFWQKMEQELFKGNKGLKGLGKVLEASIGWAPVLGEVGNTAKDGWPLQMNYYLSTAKDTVLQIDLLWLNFTF